MASAGTFQEFAAQFYQRFRFQPQLLDVMLDILLRVSIADGALSEAEERLILAAKSIFNIGDAQYSAIKSRYIQDNDRYYAILGADRNDTNEAIRKQYRKLVKEYHPDSPKNSPNWRKTSFGKFRRRMIWSAKSATLSESHQVKTRPTTDWASWIPSIRTF